MERYENVFQYPYGVVSDVPFEMKGCWRQQYFHNDNPIVLELGCGKGEYTVGLAKLYPDVNFIGVDIKGARMWTGATQALNEGLKNVAFLRTSIEIIDRFFAEDEVQEIWLTFSDPQMKNPRKRLTSTYFMERYRRFLVDGGLIHLKTDSNFLATYTKYMVEKNKLPLDCYLTDLYAEEKKDDCKMKDFINANALTDIQTYYEGMWLKRGIPIKFVKFRLSHEGDLAEPDIEIPVDGYRSYNHQVVSTRKTGK